MVVIAKLMRYEYDRLVSRWDILVDTSVCAEGMQQMSE